MIQIGCATIELVACGVCFWESTGAVFRAANIHSHDESKKGGLRTALFQRPSARVTWLCSLFLLGYVGVEVALGGWIVTFMIRIRHSGRFASGMTATGFWLGITVGRVLLGFVTPRVGEKIAIAVSTTLLSGMDPTTDDDCSGTGLYSLLDGIRDGAVAGASVLCIGGGRIPARVLPRPPVSGRGGDGDQTAPTSPACQLHRVRRGLRR